ncbi:unnamed protein product, partial [Allacma fusca]
PSIRSHEPMNILSIEPDNPSMTAQVIGTFNVISDFSGRDFRGVVFGMQFPKEFTCELKALVMGAGIMTDFTFCETQSSCLFSCLSYSDDEDEELIGDDTDSWTFYKLSDIAIQWRPHRLVHKFVVYTTLPLLLWTILFLLFGEIALPGGILFALFIIEVGGIGLGLLVRFVKLPALLGMLAIGVIIRNVPYVDIIGSSITTNVSSPLRSIALVIILIKAGIGLDPSALMKLKGFVLSLAFVPSFFEAVIVAIGTKFMLDFPWSWAFLLGFIISAVSPAVIVPCLLGLKKRGYQLENGISTVVVAVSSLADILSISLFGICVGFVFSMGGVVESIIQGPVEVIFGVAFGLIWGYIMGIVLLRNIKRSRRDKFLHVLYTFGGGIISIFGFKYVGYPGAGPLACLILAFMAGLLLRKKNMLRNDIDDDSLSWAFGILWYVFQPLLFGLIGWELDILNLDGRVVGYGALCLVLGILGRFIITFAMLHGSDFNKKEKIFVALAWIPKATVQAALGPVALDAARSFTTIDPVQTTLGLQVLTIAVVAILVTAPLGASVITLIGPKLLQKKDTLTLRHIYENETLEPATSLINEGKRDYGSLSEKPSSRRTSRVTRVSISADLEPQDIPEN